MKKIFIYAAICVIVATGCKKNSAESEDIIYYSEAIKKITKDDGLNWVVILPGMGCHGCIQEGELFMKENIKNKSVLFVLTKVESLKILQQKTGINISNYNNVYIDKEGLFDIPTDNNIYPCIIELVNGVVTTIEFQSPDNSLAFEQLRTKTSI